MTIEDKARIACDENIAVDIEWDPSPRPMEGVLVAFADDSSLRIEEPGYAMTLFYKDINSIEFVDAL